MIAPAALAFERQPADFAQSDGRFFRIGDALPHLLFAIKPFHVQTPLLFQSGNHSEKLVGVPKVMGIEEIGGVTMMPSAHVKARTRGIPFFRPPIKSLGISEEPAFPSRILPCLIERHPCDDRGMIDVSMKDLVPFRQAFR